MNTLEAQMLLRYSDLSYRDEASSDDWARMVQAFPLFSGIGRRRLRKVVRQASLLEFAPAETVVYRDMPADSIYVILGGTARAHGVSEARTLRVGDDFGDAGSSDPGRVETTVVAMDYLHVMRLPRASFHRDRQRGRAISFARIRNLGTARHSRPSCLRSSP